MRWTLGMTVRWALTCYWARVVVFFSRRRGSLLLLPRPVGLPVLLALDLVAVATYPLVRVMYDDQLRRAVQLAVNPLLRDRQSVNCNPRPCASDPLLRGRRVVVHRRPGSRGRHLVVR